jgi:lipopolysaccharide export system ATP-binding protein
MYELENKGLVLDGIFFGVSSISILQGTYLKVMPGAICGLFGRNGSGKSTLIKVAAGQIIPDSGITVIDGENFPQKMLRRRFEKISYLPQDSMLPGDMKVQCLIDSFPGDHKNLSDDPIICELLSRRVYQLSNGLRRYFEIQLLLSLERPYILLDEPFTGIEPLMIEKISDKIVEAAKHGKGMLLTDHYHHEAIPIVSDAYLMIDNQCRHLNKSVDLKQQLRDYGYLSDKRNETLPD